jgi:nitrate/TMAO reductase-like tetraheme cytochrome c subunit
MGAVTPHAIAVAAGVAALLFLLTLVLVSDVPDSPARHWILLFGIAVVPTLALGLGATTVMDDAKRPAFCGSCHVMHPFIEDLTDPASTTLAAVHYQNRYILENQCYTCHTDYGPFGPFQAKLDGARHLWKYETGTWRLPIRLVTPYRSANCLHCHGEAKVFREQHADMAAELESGSVGCLDCHGPAHPAPETRS